MVDGPVCVVGAGSAGLAVAQALAARGVPFTVLEAGSGVGGNWRYENDSGTSSCYASLRTNVSRQRTSYRSLPLPRRGPTFLGHADMLAYLERFTDHHGLREHIRFRTRVAEARPDPDGGWEVTTDDGTTSRARAVVVAVGYNSVPQVPDLPGSFDGLQLHAHDYRVPDPFADRDVVVVGLGCSATELACEVRAVARSVTIAARSGSHVTARRVGRLPIDWFDTRVGSRIPWALRRRIFGGLTRLAAGDARGAGLPRPDGRLGDKPIAVSDDLVHAVRRGEIRVTGPVTALAGDRVRLDDGSELPAQAILFGTGYRASFPFLPADVDPPTNERAPLYRGVASTTAPGLFFAGIVVGHGALIPMFEAQANWIADVLAGRLELPAAEVMEQSVAADDRVRRRDFDPRFGFLWDRLAYVRALERESRRARRRAGRPRRPAAATLRA